MPMSRVIDALLGVVVLFVVGSDWWVRHRAPRPAAAEPESEAAHG